MKTILRSMTVAVLGLAMMLIGIGSAAAQDSYAPTVPTSPALPDPGPFSNAPANLSTEAGSLSANAAAFQTPNAVAAAAGTGGGAGGDLAFTGAESTVLAAAGMTLVLLGGGAVVVSRRKA